MSVQNAQRLSPLQLLDRMFAVEMRFLKSDSNDAAALGAAFHPDVTIHEPASLPYAGRWTGLEGVAALFREIGALWSNIGIADLQAARDGNTVFMTCRLALTTRANGRTIVQPFAEVLRFENELLIDGTPFYHDTGEILQILQDPA